MSCSPEDISEDEGVTLNQPSVCESRLKHGVFTTLHDALGTMYKEEEFTDLEVRVEDKVFKCHRVIMAAMSGYFRSLLASGMQESQNGHVELTNLSASSFDSILVYIYYGENIITADMVGELLKASVFLQIKPLEDECADFMHRSLGPANCISVWKAAKNHGCLSLREKAWTVIVKNFAEVSRLEEFLSLDKDDFVAILDDDQLSQDTEDPICDAVLEWIKTDQSSREEYLVELLTYVCLPKVTGEFLFDKVLSENELMKRNPRFKDLAHDALAYHLKPDQRINIMARQSKLRGDNSLKKVVTLIGGYYIADDPQRCVISFDMKRKKWYAAASITHDPGVDFATCVLKNEIYISGGSRSLEKFVKYTPSTNDWISQPSLITGRECHSMAVVGESVYVIGGRNSQHDENGGLIEDIEAYNTKTGTWAKVGKLQRPLESLSCVAHKGKLYTCGGLDENQQSSSAIQCFDPSTEACSLAGSLPEPSDMTSAIAMNSNIYILCSEGKVYRFDVSDASVTKVADFDARSKFGLFVQGYSLVVVGGEKDDASLTDEILNIDVLSGKVTRADIKLPIPFSGFRMESLVVPKAMLVQEGFNVMGQNLFDPELEIREQTKKKWSRRHQDDFLDI